MNERTPPARPELTQVLTGAEFLRWYWLVAELRAFATSQALPTRGNKAVLTERIRALLDGEPPPTAPARTSVDRLTGALTPDTVVPQGQRMTVAVRAFMVSQCGPRFRFDRRMRAFFAEPRGRTLGDAVALWLRPVESSAEIEQQFEYNRFMRADRYSHPSASHADVVAAWRARRALPRDRPT